MSDGASKRRLKTPPVSIHSKDARMRRPFVLLLLLLLAGGDAALAQPPRATEVFERAAPSVVVVRSESPNKVQGSGVILSVSTEIDSTMMIATNAHVVGNAAEVTVEKKGKRVTGRVLYRDAGHDMALVRAPLVGREASVAHFFTLRVGETVYAIGNPFGLEISITEGIVSGLRTQGALSLIQTTAAISPGSSGGGLFTGDGRLVGITSSRMLAGENIGFAIDIRHYSDVIGARIVRDVIVALLKEDTEKTPVEKENILRPLNSDRFTTWLAFRNEKYEGTGFFRGPLPRRLWLILLEEFQRMAKSEQDADAAAFVNRVNKTIADFLASEARSEVAPAPPSRGHDNPQFVLVCQLESTSGREPGQSFSFQVNLDTSTVNGQPARVLDTTILFTWATMFFVIDRFSGQMLVRVAKEDQDRTFRGTCQRALERRF